MLTATTVSLSSRAADRESGQDVGEGDSGSGPDAGRGTPGDVAVPGDGSSSFVSSLFTPIRVRATKNARSVIVPIDEHSTMQARGISVSRSGGVTG
jgi:hypothetical protein